MKKFWKLLPIIAASATPIVAVSCGREITSAAKLKQEQNLKSDELVKRFESQWKMFSLANLYGIHGTNIDTLKNNYETAFKDSTSQLYKDSWKAFQAYAYEKLNSDENYFNKKQIDWIKNQYFNAEQITALGGITAPNTLPTEDKFKIYWSVDKTDIRDDIENLLLVKQYFAISSAEEIKKVDKDFKNNSSRIYALDHYYLSKYAAENKYTQEWKLNKSQELDSNTFFIQGDGVITGYESFNNFLKDTPEYTQTIKESQIITQTNKDDQEKLRGYAGIIKGSSTANLKWSVDNLKNLTKDQTYGYYSINQEKLINSVNDPNFATNGYNPYQSQNNKSIATVAYINQITPIGENEMTTLPEVEGKEDKTKEVKLLSFKNTIFAQSLDDLSFLFAIKDSSLTTKAVKAIANLGYKIKVDSVAPQLRDALKDKPYIE